MKNKETTNKPKVISLFSGAGGFDLGFILEGYETVWAIDSSKMACKTFEKNIGGVVCCGDIRDIDPHTDPTIPPRCNIIIGGFPCQDFSTIGKRQGLNGRYGNLFENFVDFVDAKRPEAFVAENVKGLVSIENGKIANLIIEKFEKLGYLVKPHIYIFADYGVPQLRERILFVGVRLDTGFSFSPPSPSHGPRGRKPYVTVEQALEGVSNVPFNNNSFKMSEKSKRILDLIPEGGNLATILGEKRSLKTLRYRRIKRDEPILTILAATGSCWYHYPESRPLTNRELARLQSFPDTFFFEGCLTEVYRQIGNAVPPIGARAVARRLFPLFTGAFKRENLFSEYEKMKKMTIKERLKYVASQVEKNGGG